MLVMAVMAVFVGTACTIMAGSHPCFQFPRHPCTPPPPAAASREKDTLARLKAFQSKLRTEGAEPQLQAPAAEEAPAKEEQVGGSAESQARMASLSRPHCLLGLLV
jgi:hypothetical protein